MKVGIIGTKATISSRAYEKALKSINPEIEVISTHCPLFVPLVEEGWLKEDVTKMIARRYLNPLKKKEIDVLILGCTHYPLLKSIICGIIGRGVRLIDSAIQTAKAVKKILTEDGILGEKRSRGRHKFFVTDEPELFSSIGSKFLGRRISDVKKVDIGI